MQILIKRNLPFVSVFLFLACSSMFADTPKDSTSSFFLNEANYYLDAWKDGNWNGCSRFFSTQASGNNLTLESAKKNRNKIPSEKLYLSSRDVQESDGSLTIILKSVWLLPVQGAPSIPKFLEERFVFKLLDKKCTLTEYNIQDHTKESIEHADKRLAELATIFEDQNRDPRDRCQAASMAYIAMFENAQFERMWPILERLTVKENLENRGPKEFTMIREITARAMKFNPVVPVQYQNLIEQILHSKDISK